MEKAPSLHSGGGVGEAELTEEEKGSAMMGVGRKTEMTSLRRQQRRKVGKVL